MELKEVKGKASIVALAILIITLPTIIHFAYQSGLAQSATIIFEHPIGTASYIFWSDSGTYYAKDDNDGSIDYSGTNATVVTQNGFDACPLGGRFFFTGDFQIGGHLDPPSNSIIDGAEVTFTATGTPITVFHLGGDHGVSAKQNITIRNLRINGAGIANCIWGKNVINIIVEHNDLYSSAFSYASYPVYLRGSNIKVSYNYLHDARVGALSGKDWNDTFVAEDITFSFNTVYNTDDDGLAFDNVNGGEISHNYIDKNNQAHGNHTGGIKIFGECQRIKVVSNNILNLDTPIYSTHGIKFSKGEGSRIPNDITISGNHIQNASGSGMRIGGDWGTNEPSNIIISNNNINTTNSLGFSDDADIAIYSTFNVTIEQNIFRTFYLNTPHSPSTVYVSHNLGFVTENSGTTEASNDDWITHGLASEPTTVDLTIEEVDANYFLQLKATNATDFQIYLFDANASMVEDVDKTINWYTEYQP